MMVEVVGGGRKLNGLRKVVSLVSILHFSENSLVSRYFQPELYNIILCLPVFCLMG